MGLNIQSIVVACTDIQDIIWRNWSVCSYDDQLAIFRFQLSDDVAIEPYLHSWLQPDETKRAERYRREEDRLRFMYGRAIVRILAGKYMSQNPAEIRVVAGLNNKPELEGATNVHVNVSHAGNWILVAIGKDRVGIDVENINPDFPFLDILPTSFSAEERQCIDGSIDPRQLFYQLWTRKEALIKSTAKGIDDDFCRIPSLTGKHSIAGSLIGDDGNWTVSSFTVADAYLAAVACRPMVGNPKFYTIGSGLFNK